VPLIKLKRQTNKVIWLYELFLWVALSSEMIGSVRICLSLRAPLVKRTCCLSTFSLALRVQFRVSGIGRNT